MKKSKRYSAETATPSPRRLRSLYFLFNNPRTTEQEFLDAIDTVG